MVDIKNKKKVIFSFFGDILGLNLPRAPSQSPPVSGNLHPSYLNIRELRALAMLCLSTVKIDVEANSSQIRQSIARSAVISCSTAIAARCTGDA